MKNLYDDVLVKPTLHPAQYSANTDGAGVDTKGYGNGLLAVQAGMLESINLDETYEVKVQESDDNGVQDAFTDVADASVTLDRVNSVDKQYVIELLGLGTNRKRYLRAVVVVGGTGPAGYISANLLLGQADQLPVTQDNAVQST